MKKSKFRKKAAVTRKTKMNLLLIVICILIAASSIIFVKHSFSPKSLTVLADNNPNTKSPVLTEDISEKDDIPEENDIGDNAINEDLLILNDKIYKPAVKAEDIYSIGRAEGRKYAFLTFDDGPSTTVTPKILDILDDYNVKATFFVLGKMVEQNSDLLKRIAENGHGIGNHTYSHNYRLLYPGNNVDVQAFKDEINKTNDAITAAAGSVFVPRIIRFPAGSFEKWKKPMRDELATNGQAFIDWNVVNNDGVKSNIPVEEQLTIIKESIASAEASNKNLVILMHDSATKATTTEALPQIIEYIKSLGYEFGTIE